MFFIDREIASGKYPNAPYLAKKHETSVASINRDIAYMRDMFDAPIEYSFKHKGFFYSEKTYRLPAGFATAEEMLALGMTKNLMALYKGSPLYKDASSLLEKITAPIDSDENPGWYKDRIIVPPLASVPVREEIWDAVIDGIRNNKMLYLAYQSGGDKEPRNRLVRPYQLVFDTSAWYLFGYSEEREDIRLFSLSRIKTVKVTNRNFIIPPDFDYRSITDGNYFGVYISSSVEKFSVQITGSLVETQWIRERKWAADQTIKDTRDGLIISFTSCQLEKVLQWVLTQGMNAKPLKPESLVILWKKHVQKMAEALQ